MYQYFVSFYFYVVFHTVWLYNIFLFIHSPVKEHLECFQLLTIINNTVMTICIQIFGQTNVFILLSQWNYCLILSICLSFQIAVPYFKYMSTFFRNCQTGFQSDTIFDEMCIQIFYPFKKIMSLKLLLLSFKSSSYNLYMSPLSNI